MIINLRLEQAADYRIVEEVTREAFWGFTSPACDEHFLAHKLRQSPSFMPQLDYVAEDDGQIVGNVMYTKAKIVSGGGFEYEVLTFGPLSVLPQYWNKGVGSALMRHTINIAKQLGYRAIVVYGHPDYYPRFGFSRAIDYGITTPDGKNFDALMAMPLYEGALDNLSGQFHEDHAFAMDADEVAAFDKTFLRKEVCRLTPITVLTDKLNPAAQKSFQEHDLKELAVLNRFSGCEITLWDGIGEKEMCIINQTLKEYGHAQKLFPHKLEGKL